MAYIKWINGRPFVYTREGKYFGRYIEYRFAHPYGSYPDICRMQTAKLKLTRLRLMYLMDIDEAAHRRVD